MNPQNNPLSEHDTMVRNFQPLSPRISLSTPIATTTVHRRVAIAVDLSDESSYAVKWAVQNYLRPGDTVILLHVRPTSILYGVDWGATDHPSTPAQQKILEEDFDNFMTTKAAHLSKPLVDANVPFKIHIVKDRDLKERLCLEVERLGLSAMIMGSRGFGASKRASKGRLGSVSDYCVNNCVCPVVVVRDSHVKVGGGADTEVTESTEEVDLHPVPEEELEYQEYEDLEA